jgi:hypothetical protein
MMRRVIIKKFDLLRTLDRPNGMDVIRIVIDPVLDLIHARLTTEVSELRIRGAWRQFVLRSSSNTLDDKRQWPNPKTTRLWDDS